MNEENGPGGIKSGDHKYDRQQARDVQRGCIIAVMFLAMIFGSGVFAGWALTIMAAR